MSRESPPAAGVAGGGQTPRTPEPRPLRRGGGRTMADRPQLTPIAAGESAPLLIDQLMPNHHARREELIVVHADAGPCYAAVRDLDFLAVHSPLADAATWARSIPNRIAVATGRREPSPPPPSMRLADLFDRPPEEPRPTDAAWMWMPLGEDRGREIVFGAVGRFWQPDIEWKELEPHMFAAFGEHGWGKVA